MNPEQPSAELPSTSGPSLKWTFPEQPGPVPFDKHFEVFKSIEVMLKEELESLDSENLLIGLRVAYDEKNSSNEPGVYPFSVETGYLELVDNALQCGWGEEVSEEEIIERTMASPIPIIVLDTMYEFAKAELEGAVDGIELNVGVFIETKSNPIYYAGVACACGNVSGKKNKCVGTSTTNKGLCSCRLGC